ncbi:hypothetical protein [Salinibacter ruber]|uniref:AbiU2 domain-containing protein n=1 Tax=Salinibacter ruber TaxID=146919 RepID=UPI00216784ED|nr:hypothetical protein [Salinibacter ruber]MCS3783883.1 hypothetical protein [Salinibacter ruber]
MSTAREHISERVDYLQNECLKGLLHYRIWNQIGDSILESEHLQDRFRLFFQMTLSAHLDCATLYLNRLLDKSSGSVSIRTLLRRAEKHPEAFDNADSQEVQEIVDHGLSRLDDNRERIMNLREQRRRHFVHLDSSAIPSFDEVYEDNPLERRDIYELLELIANILNDLLGALRNGEMVMEMMEEKHTEFLIDFLEEALERREQERIEELKRRTSD